ncbi:hypothetical protein D3C71_1894610 [compost metagenome]
MFERLAVNIDGFDGRFGCGDFQRIQFLERAAGHRNFGADDVDRRDTVASADGILGGGRKSRCA